MSFASQVKAELCRQPPRKKCCAVAMAYGALLYCNTFSPREIRLVTARGEFAALLPRLFRRAFGLGFDEQPEPEAQGKRRFLITEPEDVYKRQVQDRAGIRPAHRNGSGRRYAEPVHRHPR